MYSQLKVAVGEDSKITISMEDLNKLIENQVEKKVQEKVKTLEEKVELQEKETKDKLENYT